MASPKRPQENASMPEAPVARTLPADIMLDIVARSDARTLVRCAAVSKLLRRDILGPDFVRGTVVVSHQGVAPCILVHLRTCYDNKIPTLVHPVTRGAASFCDDHLAPFMSSRDTARLFDEYFVLTSRRGLLLLRRRFIRNRPESDTRSKLCVYDPMSGVRTFLSEPPGIQNPHEYVLLTAADGIDFSFVLLVADQYDTYGFKVQTASSRAACWGPVTNVCGDRCHPWWSLKNPAVLRGGVIHGLEGHHNQIVSYDVVTRKLGSVKLPPTCRGAKQLHLATSSDGKLLKLLVIERFTMFVWLQLPGGGSDWSLEVVIDMEEKLRSIFPDIADGLDRHVEFEGSGKRNGQVVFLEVRRVGYFNSLISFDLETKEVLMQQIGISLLEIDLPYRLQTMKIVS